MTQPPNNPGPIPPAPRVGEVQNGYQWNGQQWVPAGPQKAPGKPWYKKWWVWVIIVFVLAGIGNAINGDDDAAAPASAPSTEAAAETTESEPTTEAPAPETTAGETASEEPATVTETTEAPAPQETTEAPAPQETTEAPVADEPAAAYGDYPADQAAFIAGVDAAREAYEAGETDLQRSKAISDRDKNLIGTLGGPNMKNWVGVIDEVGANGEGKAHVTIKISDDIKVKTWNNAFSDMMDNTLIPDTDPVFDSLLALKPGDKVTFSGAFLPGDGTTLHATNMTDVFSALTPEFLFKFTAVAPA